MRFVSAFTVLLAVAAPATASTLISNGLGQLTGISGLQVNGSSYDVSFRDGTCLDVYSGCDSSQFTFNNEQDSAAAAAALMEAIDTDPVFDGAPWLTVGCETRVCLVDVPYFVSSGILFSYAFSNTDPTWPYPDDVLPDSFYAIGDPGPSRTFAVFSATAPAAVPEPATWVMMLFGFFAIGVVLRHRRKPVLAQLA